MWWIDYLCWFQGQLCLGHVPPSLLTSTTFLPPSQPRGHMAIVWMWTNVNWGCMTVMRMQHVRIHLIHSLAPATRVSLVTGKILATKRKYLNTFYNVWSFSDYLDKCKANLAKCFFFYYLGKLITCWNICVAKMCKWKKNNLIIILLFIHNL